jgi:hypothetical protein
MRSCQAMIGNVYIILQKITTLLKPGNGKYSGKKKQRVLA